MDMERALTDPSSVFSHPEDILQERALSRDEKLRILRRWEYDARQLQVAEEENMGGGPPNRLDEVLSVLQRLGYQGDLERGQTTKHGGL